MTIAIVFVYIFFFIITYLLICSVAPIIYYVKEKAVRICDFLYDVSNILRANRYGNKENAKKESHRLSFSLQTKSAN